MGNGNDLADTLWLVWCLYWLSAALVGAFIGSALWDLVKLIVKKLYKWYKGE